MANSTWLGSREPEVQADPEEAVKAALLDYYQKKGLPVPEACLPKEHGEEAHGHA